MNIKKKAIAYTGEHERIVDFDNEYHSCNCEGYDSHCLAHAYYDGAMEERKRIEDALKEWCNLNLFNGTSCVETPFERSEELIENLFKFISEYDS